MSNSETTKFVHITPRTEDAIHQTGRETCWCKPRLYTEGDDTMMIAVHRYKDGEECFHSEGNIWRPLDEQRN